MKESRQYKMQARAASTQATRERIIGSMLKLCLERWVDEVTLRDIADDAGVSLQTVLNHFSTKEGVLTAMLQDPRLEQAFGGERLHAEPSDIPTAVRLLLQNYEQVGDAVIRLLALESKIPSLGPVLAFGRLGHRGWAERTFAGALEGLEPAPRNRRLMQLVCATDVYTWQILRRDQGLSSRQVALTMTEMIETLCAAPEASRERGVRR